MATIITATDQVLDMEETALASLLKPTIASVTPDQMVLTYPGGFTDMLSGEGFTMSDGQISGGTITRIDEMRDDQLVFSISDIELPAQLLASWFDAGDYSAFFDHVLSGSSTLR